jgi:hypothetical protein
VINSEIKKQLNFEFVGTLGDGFLGDIEIKSELVNKNSLVR